MRKKNDGIAWGLLALVVFMNVISGTAAAETEPVILSDRPDTLLDEIKRGFYSRINVLAFGVFQEPEMNSRLNFNNFQEIPTYQASINPRVDLNLDFRRLELGIKQRFIYLWQRWEEGFPEGEEDGLAQFYTNEWFARYRLMDELFVSYGRENLQWGPSVLLSSSNPFNKENGRNNPRVEVPGLGYARAVWIPNATWAVSFIANTDEGRLGRQQGFGLNQTGFADGSRGTKFEPTYAFKIDWTGDGKYFSVIPSYREHTGYRVGFFGGWNVTDALLVYGEGAHGDYGDYELLGGASYTFEAGPTINLEYFHNENGCVQDRIEQCFFRDEIDASDPMFRQDYMMFQYSETDIWNVLNVNLRVIHNLNDQSDRLIGIFEYEANDHTLLYVIANGFTGSTRSEFGSFLNYSFFVGAAYTF
ncbi:uncharacterized protein sS8_4166 [Methylocaldum marinum]|uniref:Phosphate-selective porin O and P n=1 Tax=Methylocaldum marinum TaxID=1432792 RepID=A0A250KX50_9GAMM|nr:hypothetical protein [Methylocaldum marinum]BBA36096.1 uncharacterized protein sS8_4166 [Methylocaldum marinum]